MNKEHDPRCDCQPCLKVQIADLNNIVAKLTKLQQKESETRKGQYLCKKGWEKWIFYEERWRNPISETIFTEKEAYNMQKVLDKLNKSQNT